MADGCRGIVLQSNEKSHGPPLNLRVTPGGSLNALFIEWGILGQSASPQFNL